MAELEPKPERSGPTKGGTGPSGTSYAENRGGVGGNTNASTRPSLVRVQGSRRSEALIVPALALERKRTTRSRPHWPTPDPNVPGS